MLNTCLSLYKSNDRNSENTRLESANIETYTDHITYSIYQGEIGLFGKVTDQSPYRSQYVCITNNQSNIIFHGDINDQNNSDNLFDIFQKNKFYKGKFISLAHYKIMGSYGDTHLILKKIINDREKEYYKNNPQYQIHPSLKD